MRAAQPSTSAAWRVAARDGGAAGGAYSGRRRPSGCGARPPRSARTASSRPTAPRCHAASSTGRGPRRRAASSTCKREGRFSIARLCTIQSKRTSMSRFLGMVVGARWRRLCAFAIAMVMLVQGPASPNAQTGANGPFLSAPTLPATLPGGVPLPTLPPAAQAEILQRILEGAGTGRAAAPPTPASLATPIPPLSPPAPAPAAAAPSPAPATPDEPFSPAEAFFAAREPAPSRCASSATKASPLPRGRRVRSDRASARCPTTT